MALNIPVKQTNDQLTAAEFNSLVAEVNNSVKKEEGKALSTNDYTTQEKEKLSQLSSINVADINVSLEAKADKSQVYTKTDTDQLIEEARISLNLTPEQLASLSVNLTPITTELSEINPFPVKGKKMIVLGDSLSASGSGSMNSPSVGSWCQYTKTLLKLNSLSRVIAQGGATCNDKQNTSIKVDKADWTGDNNTLSNQVYSLINHYKTNAGTANEFVPDIVYIMIGTNDSHTVYPDTSFANGYKTGDWATCMYSLFVDTDYDLYDLSNSVELQKYQLLRTKRQKFYWSYKWAIEAILHWFPNTSIYILSPMANNGGRGQNIFEFTLPACKKIADFMACGWIDVHCRSGLSYYTNTRKDNGWSGHWYTTDGTHPNSNPGMELIGRFVAIETLKSYFVKPSIIATKVPMSGESIFYSINIVNANENIAFGTTSPLGVQSIIKGGSLTVSILPSEGYYVYSVKVNGVEQGMVSSYTFNNVQSNQEIIVEFALGSPEVETYTVSASVSNSAYGEISPTLQEVPAGGSGSVVATANEGYEIKSWSGADEFTGVGTRYGTASVSNVTANKSIVCQLGQVVQATSKRILSFYWPVGDKEQIVDGVTKMYVSGPSGVIAYSFGSITFNSTGVINYTNTIGKTTGNNSGIYPDIFLERSIRFDGNSVPGLFSISGYQNGTYRIKVLTNISSAAPWASYIAPTTAVLIAVNGGTPKNPIKIADNTDSPLVFDNVVVSDGKIDISITISDVTKRCAINVIEIEKLS